MARIRTWWHATLLGLALGTAVGAAYGMLLALLPGLAGRVWIASLPMGWGLLAGAGLGLCYGAASGIAGAITLSVDARLARQSDAWRRLGVRTSAAVSAAIAVIVVFLLLALAVWLVQDGVDLSNSNLLALVVIPDLFAAGAAALVAQVIFDLKPPGLAERRRRGPAI
ncbi:MAG: hypothetical protein ACRDMV_16005 [Streptosporangiales bacterium]